MRHYDVIVLDCSIQLPLLQRAMSLLKDDQIVVLRGVNLAKNRGLLEGVLRLGLQVTYVAPSSKSFAGIAIVEKKISNWAFLNALPPVTICDEPFRVK